MTNAQSIQPFDWKRVLIGETPWWFMLEVVFRAGVSYLLLMTMIRLMGKRVAGQMSLS